MLIFPFQLNKELKRSGARYRGLNLYLDPFYLPPPICLTPDAHRGRGADYIMLWDLSTISLQSFFCSHTWIFPLFDMFTLSEGLYLYIDVILESFNQLQADNNE